MDVPGRGFFGGQERPGGRKLVGVEGGAGEGVGRVGGMFDEISPAVGKVLVFYSQWADAEWFEARK